MSCMPEEDAKRAGERPASYEPQDPEDMERLKAYRDQMMNPCTAPYKSIFADELGERIDNGEFDGLHPPANYNGFETAKVSYFQSEHGENMRDWIAKQKHVRVFTNDYGANDWGTEDPAQIPASQKDITDLWKALAFTTFVMGLVTLVLAYAIVQG